MKHRKNHLQIQALCEGAVMLALATVLSLIRLFPLPNGGSVNLGMLPLLFYCLRWGLGKGVLCCTGYALLQLLIDGAYGSMQGSWSFSIPARVSPSRSPVPCPTILRGFCKSSGRCSFRRTGSTISRRQFPR